MAYIVCAEEMDGRWIAHVPDLPGCFSAHKDRDVAIKGVPSAIESYVLWCQRHGMRVSGLAGPMTVREVIRAWTYEDEYEVKAFFASDRPPVVAEELDEYRRLLEMTRADLLATVEGLAPQDLAKEFSGERWPILGILRHVANADLWYLDSVWGWRCRSVYAYRGQADEAFAWLERGYVKRPNYFAYSFKTDPLLAPIRADPRYAAWLRKLNLPEG